MAFIGPFTLVVRTAARLRSIGWTRAAGGLAFTTLLGLVPAATVAFAVVAQFPVFQEFLHVLENYLLRYMLPRDATEVVQTYVVGLATGAASVRGYWLIFVVITAVLMVDSVESEINEIWGIRRKRPILRRILVYTVGVTAGPVLIGATIFLIQIVLRESVSAVKLHAEGVAVLRQVVPFLITLAFFTLLYWVAPARPVRWLHAFASGALAAVATDTLRVGFAWYVEHSPSYELLYGALAAVPIFLLWIYLFWMIVLAGAAVTATLANA
ncbi:MAG: YihY family inner membrane protein [Burkholderiales bacterium]